MVSVDFILFLIFRLKKGKTSEVTLGQLKMILRGWGEKEMVLPKIINLYSAGIIESIEISENSWFLLSHILIDRSDDVVSGKPYTIKLNLHLSRT